MLMRAPSPLRLALTAGDCSQCGWPPSVCNSPSSKTWRVTTSGLATRHVDRQLGGALPRFCGAARGRPIRFAHQRGHDMGLELRQRITRPFGLEISFDLISLRVLEQVPQVAERSDAASRALAAPRTWATASAINRSRGDRCRRRRRTWRPLKLARFSVMFSPGV